MRKGGFALVILMLAVTAGCSSGGATVSGNGGGTVSGNGGVSPGNNSPKAAVAGFFKGAVSNQATACAYVDPADEADCSTAFNSAEVKYSGSYGIGNQVIAEGTQALVSLTGNYCITTIAAGSTSQSCSNNSSDTGGLPPNSGSFSTYYADALLGGGKSLPKAVPCDELNGKWYVTVVQDGSGIVGPNVSITTPPTIAGTVPATTTPTTIPVPSTTPSTAAAPTTTTTQPPTTGQPIAGSYSGRSVQGYDVDFYVSNTKTALQDITSTLQLTCAPGDSVPSVAVSLNLLSLNSDGSFASTRTQSGDYKGNAAKFTIDFEGNFHGLNSDGVAQVAGSITETMTYSASGTSYTCTSNEVPWSDTRDTQQTLTTGPAPAGGYSGRTVQGYDADFSVSSNQKALQNVSYPLLLTCAPGDGSASLVAPIDSVSLNSDGSFESTTTQSGDYKGNAAKFTIDFQGNFHGLNSDGVAQAAGSITETMTYSASGTSYTCSSNQVAWSVSHS